MCECERMNSNSKTCRRRSWLAPDAKDQIELRHMYGGSG